MLLDGLPNDSGGSRRDRPSSSSEEVSRDQELAGWIDRLDGRILLGELEVGRDRQSRAVLDDLAGCLEAVAESLALAREAQGHSKAFESALQIVAEAQSALASSVSEAGNRERSGPGERLRVAASHGRPAPRLPSSTHAGRRPRRALGMALASGPDRAGESQRPDVAASGSRSSIESDAIRRRSVRGRDTEDALDGDHRGRRCA